MFIHAHTHIWIQYHNLADVYTYASNNVLPLYEKFGICSKSKKRKKQVKLRMNKQMVPCAAVLSYVGAVLNKGQLPFLFREKKEQTNERSIESLCLVSLYRPFRFLLSPLPPRLWANQNEISAPNCPKSIKSIQIETTLYSLMTNFRSDNLECVRSRMNPVRYDVDGVMMFAAKI